MVIDVHAHIFPDAIAEKASASIAKFYDIPVKQGGSVDALLRLGDEAGIDKFVVHSVATTPVQVGSVLKFISSAVKAHPDRFIGFGSLHPDMENAEEVVRQMMDAGLRGVKLHPDMQLFALDEDRAFKMFESFAGKLPLLVHAGDKRYQFSNPHRIARMMDKFPEMKVIAAHMGGYSEWKEARELLAGRKNIYVDTSSTMFELNDDEMRESIAAFGVENVMFASDYPMWNPKRELEHVRSLGLTEEELRRIEWGTAAELFGL